MLNVPQDICFDKLGNLYIADVSNFRIRRIDTSGIITTFAGTGISGYAGDNGPATIAKISSITGLAVDDTGDLYLAGSSLGSNVVRKINTAGIITTIAGSNGMYTYIGDGIAATDAPMSPIKIAIDNLGQLVIADNMNDRVYRVNLAGFIYTIAGNGIEGYGGDGGIADSAELNYPSGVTFDSCSNLFIAEANNARIRKVTLNPNCWPTGVPQVVINEPTIYPNPAFETINIDNVATHTNYAIINITGIIEQSGKLKAGSNIIPIQALPMGIHLLQLTDNEGAVTVHKIVKQ